MTKVSNWYTIDQNTINSFADITHDHQKIHVDTEYAKSTPFGTTIAHGFLSLSLLVTMSADADIMGGEKYKMALNYGFNKIRFITPVKSGDRIRGHFKEKTTIEIEPGVYQRVYSVRVEIEGSKRSALIAEWVIRTYDKDE